MLWDLIIFKVYHWNILLNACHKGDAILEQTIMMVSSAVHSYMTAVPEVSVRKHPNIALPNILLEYWCS